MPDLFTHFVSARVPGSFIRDRRLQALLVIGTFLPDLAGKGIYWVLQSHDSSQIATHSVAGVLLISYLACLFVEEGLRRPGFFMLAVGGILHILLDMIKDSLGAGSALLLLPFSTAAYEFAWIDSENVVYLIPFDAALLAILWFLERRFGRVQQ